MLNDLATVSKVLVKVVLNTRIMAQITSKVLSVVPKTTDNGFDYMLLVMDNKDVVTLWPSELEQYLDQQQSLAMQQSGFHGFAPLLKAADVAYEKKSVGRGEKKEEEYIIKSIVIHDELQLISRLADAYIQRMLTI